MFPNMLTEDLSALIAKYSYAKGWKVSGAGGGGYLILVNDSDIQGSIKITVRRQ